MTNPFKIREKSDRVRAAEIAGTVADSMEVRMELMARVHSGEITLDDAKTELKKIKRGARRKGQTTRAAVYSARS